MSPSNDEIDIMMVSQLLPISTFMLSSSNDLTQLPASTDLDLFFRNKHDTYTNAGASNFFKIYGAASSYNSIVVSFLYEYPPNPELQLIPAFHPTIDLNIR
jgi:hypothetical protein